MGTGTFERLAAEGAGHVLAGSHARESTPVEGGSRWSVSCLLLPGDELAAELDAVTTEASRLTGDSHWRTGARSFAHVTVRALEHHRAQVPSGDETVARYAAALRRAAARCGPVSLRVDGLILTPATLMACATQVDGSADRLADAFAEELGADGWREGGFRRDIWYANLLHLSGDVAHPRPLVDWVADRRHLPLGELAAAQVHLARYRWVDGPGARGMQPVVLERVPLVGGTGRLRP
jgi:hypothetical protein